MSELLSVLEHMEREKGIKKEVLIEAVELALVSAVRRTLDVEPSADVKVVLDRLTGKIKAYIAGKEVQSEGFGRIAASTAKQVIIQKIREAEKDVMFNEFNAKVGEIVSGNVYRFEKGNIIIDLLGKAEALLPKREQMPGEDFHQGQRIRAYLSEVRREPKGPQIILSRAHPYLVKKLFVLEVPELYDGVVEVRAISRSAGERTKIAVYSKEEKVDSVGSCVGMRGARVKNIVFELHGERIDIVRFSEDPQTYISASLSPAEVSEIRLDKAQKKAVVIVAQDQLSLAIGKHGQNVRLASKLTGWEIDVRLKEEVEDKKIQDEKARILTQTQTGEEVASGGEPLESAVSIGELSGVGEKTKSALMEAGFSDLHSVSGANMEDLIKVKGIGEAKAKKLISEAKKLVKKMR